jgi:hypothetical protein
MKEITGFFTTSTIKQMSESADKPFDNKYYGSLNDIQFLHHIRDEYSKILYNNEKISAKSRDFIRFSIEMINNKMDYVRRIKNKSK